MTPGDFLKRTRGMQEHLRRNTLHKWAERFVDILDKPIHVPDVNVTRTLTPTIATELIAQYHQSRRRLILFDYDGTLQPIVSRPEDAKPSSDTLSMLKRLAADSDNHVVVISGRSKDNLATWIDRSIVGPVTFVAEHGACLRLHDHRNWHRTIRAPLEWKPAVTKLFDHYAVITPGSMVEKKEWAVVWHYRNAAPFTANKHLVMLKKLLRPIAKKENLRIKAGKKVLEVHPLDISKGHAVKEWLIGSEIDFVLAIGDDTTDEDMFAALPKTSFTIKVGTGRTLANYRLRDPAAVHQLLRKL
jgi:trehalose 6-phosphate synthase/phosphatase